MYQHIKRLQHPSKNPEKSQDPKKSSHPTVRLWPSKKKKHLLVKIHHNQRPGTQPSGHPVARDPTVSP